MPRGQYDRTRTGTPVDEYDPPLPDPAGIPIQAASAGPHDGMPDLVVPINRTPSIDLTDPTDCADLPDGEWSKQHLGRFLAKQPRDMVLIPKESWEPKGEDVYQIVGYCGHWFRILKGKPVSVPLQIAALIEQSQRDFPTSQSQAKKRQLTDIRDLDPSAGRGVGGVEIFL